MQVKTDLRQSQEYARFMGYLGWSAIKIETANAPVQVFVKKLGLGAVAKLQRVRTPLPWKEILQVLKTNRVFYTRFEPSECDIDEQLLKGMGFTREKSPLRATKTILIDLTPDPEKILESFGRARSNLRKLDSKNLVVKKNDFEEFYKIWRQATKKQNLWCASKKEFDIMVESFGNNVFCITIDKGCGVFILIYEKTAYYYYAAGLPEAKDKNLPYLAVWEAMMEAKKRGCKVWDWEGVYDERWPNKGWKGFSQFKRTFGGEELILPGSWARWSYW